MNREAKIGIALVATGAAALLFWPRKSIRERIVDAAKSELGVQDPQRYWQEVIPGAAGDTFTGQWCGGFSLWVLHQAGVGQDVPWEIGKGFLYLLPRTSDPQPGDIAYMDQPYQHHAVVVESDGTSITTVDGNQPGSMVKLRTRPVSAWTAFYSVQPWIDAA
jgi:hypothetical protein